jgi:hypothetical protein
MAVVGGGWRNRRFRPQSVPNSEMANVSCQGWPQRERLTFDTKGEIIIFVERVAALRRKRAGSLALLAHSFIPS